MILGYAFNYGMENLWFFIPQANIIIICILVILAAALVVTNNDVLYGLALGSSMIIGIFIGSEPKDHLTGAVVFFILFGMISLLRKILQKGIKF